MKHKYAIVEFLEEDKNPQVSGGIPEAAEIYTLSDDSKIATLTSVVMKNGDIKSFSPPQYPTSRIFPDSFQSSGWPSYHHVREISYKEYLAYIL